MPKTVLESVVTAGRVTPRVRVEGVRPSGMDVEILEKDTRATATSLGFPIEVNRAHPDFAALSVARAWLGEHRAYVREHGEDLPIVRNWAWA